MRLTFAEVEIWLQSPTVEPPPGYKYPEASIISTYIIFMPTVVADRASAPLCLGWDYLCEIVVYLSKAGFP
jgi:hypothetical protein